MATGKIITFRVSDDYFIQVKNAAKDLGKSVSDLMVDSLENFFHPPAPEIKEVEKIVEVEKFVDREVIKEVVIDSEGTVQGHSVSLSDALYAELTKIKFNPDTSMDSFVGDILWNRIQWSQNKKSPATAQKNGTSQNSTVQEERRFDYWNKRIADCDEHDYDEQDKIREGLKNETEITEKQRQLLQRGGTLRRS